MPNSQEVSKMKQFQNVDLDKETKHQLIERLMCCICMDKPRSMLIQTCKHVPFCKECDMQVKLKSAESGIPLECPLCRKVYKKTIPI